MGSSWPCDCGLIVYLGTDDQWPHLQYFFTVSILYIVLHQFFQNIPIWYRPYVTASKVVLGVPEQGRTCEQGLYHSQV